MHTKCAVQFEFMLAYLFSEHQKGNTTIKLATLDSKDPKMDLFLSKWFEKYATDHPTEFFELYADLEVCYCLQFSIFFFVIFLNLNLAMEN